MSSSDLSINNVVSSVISDYIKPKFPIWKFDIVISKQVYIDEDEDFDLVVTRENKIFEVNWNSTNDDNCKSCQCCLQKSIISQEFLDIAKFNLDKHKTIYFCDNSMGAWQIISIVKIA